MNAENAIKTKTNIGHGCVDKSWCVFFPRKGYRRRPGEFAAAAIQLSDERDIFSALLCVGQNFIAAVVYRNFASANRM